MVESCTFRGPQDVARMRTMLVDARARAGHGFWHAGDLVWRLFLHSLRYDLHQELRLWADTGGTLLGFAIVTPLRPGETLYFDLQIHPEHRGQGLEAEMLDWIKVRARQSGAGRLSTDVGVYDDDLGQLAELQRRGFARAGGDGLLLLRPLDEPIDNPALPSGFALRPVSGPAEAPQRAAAHRDAFHPSRITAKAYRRLMHTPGYVPQLDLVAVAADGTFGAFCLGWLDGANRVAEFEPVGTRAAFRRMGLARAVLLEGLRRMKTLEAQSAVVGPVNGDDEAVTGLYAAVGFRPIHETWMFVREAAA